MRSKFAYFCLFLTFRDLQDVKRSQSFSMLFFGEIKDREKKKSTGKAMKQKIGPTKRAKFLTMCWGPLLVSWVQSLQLRLDRTVLTYDQLYIPPMAILQWGRRETRNIQYRSADFEDRRGDAASQSRSRLPLWLHWHHHLQYHDKEGVVHSLDYGIVKVTCIKLSLVLRWLESHETPIIIVTIYVLPLWWIFCLWDAKMFFVLMYEYMYMLPRSCILVLIKIVR
jgi:hypothetical protein